MTLPGPHRFTKGRCAMGLVAFEVFVLFLAVVLGG
jgi:hypothetical protein